MTDTVGTRVYTINKHQFIGSSMLWNPLLDHRKDIFDITLIHGHSSRIVSQYVRGAIAKIANMTAEQKENERKAHDNCHYYTCEFLFGLVCALSTILEITLLNPDDYVYLDKDLVPTTLSGEAADMSLEHQRMKNDRHQSGSGECYGTHDSTPEDQEDSSDGEWYDCATYSSSESDGP